MSMFGRCFRQTDNQGQQPPPADTHAALRRVKAELLPDECEEQLYQLQKSDEIVENTAVFAKQMTDNQGPQQQPPPADTQRSEEAKAELLDECEEQFYQLQKLQYEIVLADTEICDSGSSEATIRVNGLIAELEQWQELEPKLLSTNPEVLLAVGKEELQRLNTQLEMVLSSTQAKRDSLKETLKREKRWLEEKKLVLSSATEQVESLRCENNKLSEHSVLQDMKRKIQTVKNYQSSLVETLSDMLEHHFPLPDNEGNSNKKKKAPSEPGVTLISLSEIIELLTNKTLETPHEPYVTIDETFWPPYIEMLLRNGIAMRHSEDCNKVRLENFY